MKTGKIKIGDVCELKYGKALKSESRSGGKYPVYGSSGIVGYHNEYLVEKPTLIIGRKGSVGEIHFAESPCWPIDTAYFLEYDAKRIHLKWFKSLLATLNLKSLDKSAAVPGLNRKDVYDLEIGIPSLDDQIQIANILGKAEALINQRKEGLGLLDEFLVSTFLEMFGDPVKNEKTWPIKQFKNVAINENSKRVPIKQSDRDKREGIYPYYGATGVIDFIDDYRFDGEFLLLAEDGKNLQFRKKNNAFMARGQFWVNNHAHVLSENDICKLRYLEFFLNRIDFSPYISGIDQVKLNKESLERIPVPIPPLKLQNNFVEIVEKTEALKIQYQTSLQELENLYVSVSQRAFKGELQFKPDTKVIPLRTAEKEEDFFKKRKALACYIINQSLDDERFGDTKFEKLLNLSDQYAIQRNLGQNYYQKVAGPYDNEFTKLFYIQIAAEKLYKRKRRGNQSVFIPDINHKKTFTADTYFSNDELSRIDKLITYFKKYTYEEPEIISTLYAVWNNRIIRQHQITDEVLKQDFLDWDVKKKKYKDRLDAALAWMRKENIIPNGWGKLIEKPKGKQRKLVVGKKRANSKRAS
ncbi:MAG TPA: restriction endonuclease subunit S [Chryseosolibacter sp.]